jgi:hypothetical protein
MFGNLVLEFIAVFAVVFLVAAGEAVLNAEKTWRPALVGALAWSFALSVPWSLVRWVFQ